MKNLLRTSLIIFFLFVSAASFADSMRCGNKLISTGDSKAEVLIKCGEPLLQETIAIEESTEYAALALKYPGLYKRGLLRSNNGVVGRTTTLTQSIDQWTYHRGQGRFLGILYFEGGKLVAIEDGDRM